MYLEVSITSKCEKGTCTIIAYSLTKKHVCIPETTEVAELRAMMTDVKKSISSVGQTVL